MVVIRTMESAEAMIVFNKYDELIELVKKYVLENI